MQISSIYYVNLISMRKAKLYWSTMPVLIYEFLTRQLHLKWLQFGWMKMDQEVDI